MTDAVMSVTAMVTIEVPGTGDLAQFLEFVRNAEVIVRHQVTDPTRVKQVDLYDIRCTTLEA